MTTPVKFLLVDDLAENLLSLAALLEREGLVLLKARSGDEALELLLQHDFALALIDVQMPGLSGFELAELMRGNERTKRVPIIFVTAGSHTAERRFQGYEAGAVDFIQKPIEADILRSKAGIFAEIYRQRQVIAEQRDILEKQSHALKLADRRKNEFISVLVHELRNPLAAIDAGLKLLSKAGDTGRTVEIRGLIRQQMDHTVRLVDDLLDVSRISKGKITLSKSWFEMKDALNSALAMTNKAIENKQHSLVLDVPEQACSIYADQVRVTQCVSNLLHNAAKYTPNGGRILVSLSESEDTVTVRVRDNGLGLTEEGTGAIFRMFEQIDEHRDHASGGLGIGLGLVKQLMELHEGEVHAHSDGPGLGSIFTLVFPRASNGQKKHIEHPALMS